tara:strand:+ start:43 stop:390 length:348 start_codon:yes stop_codon:yes gene_type:complete
MTVKLIMLKSGEDIITDVQDIKSENGVIGYYFNDPLVVKIYESEEPKVLNEEGSNKKYSSSVGVTFFPWMPLSKDTKIPCSADWVVTIVEPVEKLKKQYQEKLNGQNNQNPTVIK